MVRDANGQKQAIVGDIPGLLSVKCVGHCFSGNYHLELQFLNRRKQRGSLLKMVTTETVPNTLDTKQSGNVTDNRLFLSIGISDHLPLR